MNNFHQRTKLIACGLVLACLYSFKSETSRIVSLKPKNDSHSRAFRNFNNDDNTKFVEKACTIDNKMGTDCESGQGKCKKEKDCEPVAPPDTNTVKKLRDAEIEYYATLYAQRMVSEGYIDPKNFESSKELAIQVLEFNNENF